MTSRNEMMQMVAPFMRRRLDPNADYSGIDMMPQPSLSDIPQSYGNTIANIVAAVAQQQQRNAQDPVGAIERGAAAGASGIASIGSPLYPDSANEFLSGQMARDPVAATAAPLLAPLPLKSAGRVVTASPRTTGAVAGTTALTTGAAADGDAGEKSYSEKLMTLQQQQNEAFQALEGIRRELEQVGDKKRSELEQLDARELQRRVGAEVDGSIGGKTRKAIEKYITGEVEAAKRDAEARLQSLQARYDTLGQEVQRLQDTESPEAVQERLRTTPTRELHPNLPLQALAGGAATGLAIGLATRGKGIKDYNHMIRLLDGDAVKYADSAVDALRAGDAGAAALDDVAAGSAAGELSGVVAKGPKYQSAPAAGAFFGTEIGANVPGVLDYTRSSGKSGDPLYDSALKSVAGGDLYPFQNLAERTAMTGIPAIAAGKLSSLGAKAFEAAPTQSFKSNMGFMDDAASGYTAGRANDLNEMLTGMAQIPKRPVPGPNAPQGPGPAAPGGGAGNKGGLHPGGQPNPPQGPQQPPVNPPAGPKGGGNKVQNRQASVSSPRKNEILDDLANGRSPAIATNKENNYADALNKQAESMANTLGISREQALVAMNEAIKSGARKSAYAVPAAVAGGTAFDQALESYRQIVIDVDGDGIPDVVVPQL